MNISNNNRKHQNALIREKCKQEQRLLRFYLMKNWRKFVYYFIGTIRNEKNQFSSVLHERIKNERMKNKEWKNKIGQWRETEKDMKRNARWIRLPPIKVVALGRLQILLLHSSLWETCTPGKPWTTNMSENIRITFSISFSRQKRFSSFL